MLISTQEDEFAVYEPYCANYVNATELMTAESENLMVSAFFPAALRFLATREAPVRRAYYRIRTTRLTGPVCDFALRSQQKYNHLINAKSELPAFLIKPVQRICKYPLLLDVSTLHPFQSIKLCDRAPCGQ